MVLGNNLHRHGGETIADQCIGHPANMRFHEWEVLSRVTISLNFDVFKSTIPVVHMALTNKHFHLGHEGSFGC